MPLVICRNPNCCARYDPNDSAEGRNGRCPHCHEDNSRIATLDSSKDSGRLGSADLPDDDEQPLRYRTLADGERFGRYMVRRRLGKGGMGAVYLAYDPNADREVALKIPSIASRQRFLREARAAANLSHPNICPLYDCGEIDGVPYMVMAYLQGQELSKWLNKRILPPREAATIARDLARSLQYAHDRKIIHRDLKPANIMVSADRGLVIMDFGLARRESDSQLTMTGYMMGTPGYMAPEQIEGDVGAMGPGCDIYSLGVILYEMLTGQLPFQGTSPISILKQVLSTDPIPPQILRPTVDDRIDAICLKAIAREIGDRFPTMRAFADALDQYLDETSPAIHEPTAVLKPGRTSGSRETQTLPGLTFSRPSHDTRPQSTTPSPSTQVATDRRVPTETLPEIATWGRRGALALAMVGLAVGSAFLAVVFSRDDSRAEPKTVESTTPKTNADLATSRTPEAVELQLDLRMVVIPGGQAMIGAPEGTDRVDPNATPAYAFSTEGFRMSQTEVTVDQYRTVMGKDAEALDLAAQKPSWPIGGVSWFAAIRFCNRLSELAGLPPYYEIHTSEVEARGGDGYRLPTEAEWEYAARAGAAHDQHFGNIADPSQLREVAWFRGVQDDQDAMNPHPKPAASFEPNAFGLHHMLGNVWEWCEDPYDENYYLRRQTDPTAKPLLTKRVPHRVRRGGSFFSPSALDLRCFERRASPPDTEAPDIGFRVVRSLR